MVSSCFSWLGRVFSRRPEPQFVKYPKLTDDVAHQIASFFDYPTLCNFSAASIGSHRLRDRFNFQLDLRFFSKIKIFDLASYQEEWRATVTATLYVETIREFLNQYFRKDILGRPGIVGDYCLTPALVPVTIKLQNGRFRNFSLNDLSIIASNSSTFPAKMEYISPNTHHFGKTISERAKLVIVMDRFMRHETWEEREEFLKSLPPEWGSPPNLLSLCVAIFAEHALTGRRYLGDQTGEEGVMCVSLTDTKEVAIGNFRSNGRSTSLLSLYDMVCVIKYIGTSILWESS